LIIKFWIKY